MKLILAGLLAVFLIGCSDARESTSDARTWETDDQGWIVTRNDQNEKERFFAIGTWHVPGYLFTSEAHEDTLSYRENEKIFRERTAPFNMVFVTPGYEKAYMSEVIHIMNPFSPMLYGYIDSVKTLPDGDDKDYYRSQFLKKEVANPDFIQYLDSQMVELLNSRTSEKYIFSHIDELALGGVSKWAVPPSTGALITERLRKADPGALVFVDLYGHGKGSTYLFEKRYLETHEAMPDDPPYNTLSSEARECKIPLLGFYQAYDGSPVYDFKEGAYSYTSYDFDELTRLWVENTRLIAEGYKESGDVFGINAFRDFYAYPALAGITVDALKEGLGEEVPLWLYFDGNGYAKPGHVAAADYLKSVKCQIYTAIVHGATGILFWNDWNKTPEVFEELLPVMHELNDNLEVIKYDTLEKIIEGDLHVAIKEDATGKKHVIATNTNKTDPISFTVPGGNRMELESLGVYISEF